MKESTKKYRVYETWDLEIPTISTRTLLYDLPPIGIGTAEVESLTGYISRLAQEHRLSPVVLLKNSVSDISELPHCLMQNSITATFAGGLNGIGESTETVTNILQAATQRNDIAFTSLISWKNKLSNYKLLKKHSAWCPQCFDEQRENGIIYEKLIWCLHRINACHIHELPLVEQCPHCSKKLKVLSGKSRPGYCSSCLCWLGSNLVQFDEFRNFRDDDEKKIEIWKVIKAGEFLSGTPFDFVEANVKNQKENAFTQNLSQLIKIHSEGSINQFSHETGLWHVTIRRVIAAEVLPTLEMILTISIQINLFPPDLFRFGENDYAEKIISPVIKKVTSKEEMNKVLENFLKEHPPPSANEVARRTGWTTMRLQRHFPDEYRQIVKRYSDFIKRKLPDLSDSEVESILQKASTEKPPPSLQSVFRKIGCKDTGYRYYQKFPELCLKIADRYKKSKLKKFDVPKAKKIMNSALDENPPPSFSEVARRIGCTRENLRMKIPELSDALNRRYKSHLTKTRSENLQLLHEEIKKAVMKLQDEKNFVSMNKVKALLPRKWNDKNFKSAYRKVMQNDES